MQKMWAGDKFFVDVQFQLGIQYRSSGLHDYAYSRCEGSIQSGPGSRSMYRVPC
jgi:hypothetical protein